MRTADTSITKNQTSNGNANDAETAKANLLGYLIELGYDASRCEHAGLKLRPDQNNLLNLISENLKNYNVQTLPDHGPNGWPHQENILVVSSSSEMESAPLNRFANWVGQHLPNAKLFFDPLHGYQTSGKGAASFWGISVPLSLGIDPERLWHPDDPTFGHELFHFLSASLFNKGVAVAYKVDLKFKEQFIASYKSTSEQSAEEFLAHRYNLKHAMGRLTRSSIISAPNAQRIDARIAVILEINFLGRLAESTVELINDYSNAMLSEDRYVQLDYQPFIGGCVVGLSLPREETSAAITVWTREATQKGVHSAMVNYFERLHSLASSISLIFQSFEPEFHESKFYTYLKSNGKDVFCDEPNLDLLLLSTGQKILQLYKQNDFTLDKHETKPNQLFARLRKALDVDDAHV